MSELTGNKPSFVTEPLDGALALGEDVATKVKPVMVWAAIGAALLATSDLRVGAMDHRTVLHASAVGPE